jgi:rhodanese-related sulfurtransferase
MKRLSILGIGVLILVILTACSQPGEVPTSWREVQVEGGSYRAINAQQLETMLYNKDFLLVNVHTPYIGEIEGTDLFILYYEIEQRLSKLPTNKAAKIVIYCRTGYMSLIAVHTLIRLGFTNVWHLDQGILGWDRYGYPILLRV